MNKLTKNIVISGWYGMGNIGDEAILQAMIDRFESQFPGCNIVALSFRPAYTEKTQKVRALRQIPFTLRGWVRAVVTGELFKTLYAIGRCDLFVMGGGGFLSDWQPGVPKAWLKQMKIAKFFGKETWLYGIGAGPFLTEKGRETTKYYIDNFVDKIVVRDHESFLQLTEIVGINKPIIIEIDPVAKMQVEKYINVNDVGDNSIALIFANYFKGEYFDEKYRQKWDVLFQAFCSQVESVIESGFVPKLVFFQENIENELSTAFVEKFGKKIKIEYPSDYKEAINILNRSKAIISFRLHGNILAHALKKPFLAVIYHHKTKGFLEQINYKYWEYILEVGDGKVWRDNVINPSEWKEKTSKFIDAISNESV